jgi:manganese/zinc/iron transport system permease protein
MSIILEIFLILVFTGAACSLVGTFLVLRKNVVLCDAVSHTALLGIVLAFFITRDLSSPFLLAGATLIGVATAYLTESLENARFAASDASTGVAYTFLFAVAVFLISKYSNSAHLDTDAVLLGEAAFATFERLKIFSVDVGAKAVYASATVLVLNAAFITMFFKELKLSTFDKTLAACFGFRPRALSYALITLVCLTCAASFSAVGSVLVIALMSAPPATALLLTNDLKRVLLLGVLIAVINSTLGFALALALDVSIAGTIASISGLTFFVILEIISRLNKPLLHK